MFVLNYPIFSQWVDDDYKTESWRGVRIVKRVLVENKTTKINDTIFNSSVEMNFDKKGVKISEYYFTHTGDTVKYVLFSFKGQEVCKSIFLHDPVKASSGSQPFGIVVSKTIRYNNRGAILSVDKKYEDGTCLTKFVDYSENNNTTTITYKIDGEIYLIRSYFYEYW